MQVYFKPPRHSDNVEAGWFKYQFQNLDYIQYRVNFDLKECIWLLLKCSEIHGMQFMKTKVPTKDNQAKKMTKKGR